MKILQLVKIFKSYEGYPVLRGIDLELDLGEAVTIRGRSGVGKTTLCRILTLLDVPDQGRVTFMGRDVTSINDSVRSTLRLKYIGYVDQFYTLIPSLTVLQNVELPLALLGVDKRKRLEKAREVLALLGLRGKEDRYPHQLSGGEKQRVAIARALVKDPTLLVGDEMFSNLDDETMSMVIDVLKSLVREKRCCIVITTTDLGFSFGDRVYLLRDGVLVEV